MAATDAHRQYYCTENIQHKTWEGFRLWVSGMATTTALTQKLIDLVSLIHTHSICFAFSIAYISIRHPVHTHTPYIHVLHMYNFIWFTVSARLIYKRTFLKTLAIRTTVRFL